MTHQTTVTYATDRNTGQPYRAAVSCSDCPAAELHTVADRILAGYLAEVSH